MARMLRWTPLVVVVATLATLCVEAHDHHHHHHHHEVGQHHHGNGRRLADHTRCSTQEPSDEVKAQIDEFVAAREASKPKPTGGLRGMRKRSMAEGDTIIPTYFYHIKNLAGDGAVTPEQDAAQMEALNLGYAETGFQFELVSSKTWTLGDYWFKMVPGTKQEFFLKKALRQGGADTLNVYTLQATNPEGDSTLLGWATFPNEYANAPLLDGVVINYVTMPGGALKDYNLGDTLTHEVGHWQGLYHTFQSGCDGLGDLLPDTPAEAEGASELPNPDGQLCPVGRDSCPDDPATDAIDNFMSYEADVCMTKFTAGQIARMQTVYDVYRRDQ